MREHSGERRFMDLAARQALRALGDVEPNPLVGAVIVRDGRVIGVGHHRRFGGPHAEREAIADAHAHGEDPRGATLFCTLEPCTHHGKTPPCTDAILAAGIARVVIAKRDPNPQAAGGLDLLRQRGVTVEEAECPLAAAILVPFAKRFSSGLPLVIAKWAQTLDGRIATRTGNSKWISNELARRRVHRLRARVDAILTGIGTVQADDPLMTARDVRVHRVARRVVVDTRLQMPLNSQLVRTARQVPLTTFFNPQELAGTGDPARFDDLQRAGVELVSAPATARGVDLRSVLVALRQRHDTSSVLVEAGPRLLGGLIEDDVVDVAIVYLAPMVLADGEAVPAAVGRVAPQLSDARRWTLARVKRLGDDLELTYLRAMPR